VAIARQYTDDLAAYLERASAASNELGPRLRAYTDFFRSTLLQGNRMCLCGFMAAEREELPPAVMAEIARYAEVNLGWLTRILDAAGHGPEPRQARALAIFTAVAGAQLVARGRGAVSLYDSAIASYRTASLLP
jgi:TetR/AcrR family transcriptional repressor of nem operon